MNTALKDRDSAVRVEATKLLGQRLGLENVRRTLETGSIAEQQAALAAFAAITNNAVLALINQQIDRLGFGQRSARDSARYS